MPRRKKSVADNDPPKEKRSRQPSRKVQDHVAAANVHQVKKRSTVRLASNVAEREDINPDDINPDDVVVEEDVPQHSDAHLNQKSRKKPSQPKKAKKQQMPMEETELLSDPEEDEREVGRTTVENGDPSTLLDEKDLVIQQLMKSQSELMQKVHQLQREKEEKSSFNPNSNNSPLVQSKDLPDYEALMSKNMEGTASGELFKKPQSRFSSLGQGLDEALKKKVKDGKYVDLVEFLPWYKGKDKASLTLTQTANGQNVLTAKNTKYKLSIENWNNAMEVYMAVFLEVRPIETEFLKSMIQYKRNINSFAAMNSIDWAGYDMHYRRIAAESGLVDWAQVDYTLLLEYGALKSIPTNNMRTVGQNMDKYVGNQRFAHCYRFNSGICSLPNCRYPHICSACRGAHPVSSCNVNKPGFRQFVEKARRFEFSANNHQNSHQDSFQRPRMPGKHDQRMNFRAPNAQYQSRFGYSPQ